jgi:hypothetical protein
LLVFKRRQHSGFIGFIDRLSLTRQLVRFDSHTICPVSV